MKRINPTIEMADAEPKFKQYQKVQTEDGKTYTIHKVLPDFFDEGTAYKVFERGEAFREEELSAVESSDS